MAMKTTTPRVKSGVGRRIYEWRTQNKISLWQLHKKSGLAYSLLWSLETKEGTRITTVPALEKLATAMNLNPAYLGGWISKSNSEIKSGVE